MSSEGDGRGDERGEPDPGAEGVAAAGPVAVRDHAREVRHDGRGDRAGQQREHHADEAVGVDQRGDAACGQHGGHGLIDEQAAGGHHAAEQHRAVLAGDFARGLVHAVPAQAEAIAVGVHHPGDDEGVQQRAGQRGVDHGPDAVAAAQKQRAQR